MGLPSNFPVRKDYIETMSIRHRGRLETGVHYLSFYMSLPTQNWSGNRHASDIRRRIDIVSMFCFSFLPGQLRQSKAAAGSRERRAAYPRTASARSGPRLSVAYSLHFSHLLFKVVKLQLKNCQCSSRYFVSGFKFTIKTQ